MKKILDTIILLLIGIIIPLFARQHLILTWPILNIAIYGILLNLTQPALNYKKEKTDQRDRNSMYFIVAGALLGFVIPIIDHAYFQKKEISINQISSVVGIMMIWGGFLFRYWSISILGKFFTSKVEIKSDHQLVQNGPYKYLRHPSYLGAWISQIGISVLLQSILGFVFSSAVYLAIYIYRIKREEEALIQAFPIEYPKYKKNTWGIVPFIY